MNSKLHNLFVKLALLVLFFLVLAGTAQARLLIKSIITFDGTDHVNLVWIAQPGAVYVINTTTNLLQAWQPAAPGQPATFTTTNNSLAVSLPVDTAARFFRVVRLDTQGPQVYQTSPLNNAIGVSQQAVLQAWLKDETGVNTNSIILAIGTNPPVTLSNPRLTWSTNGVLTYTPATNEVLGVLGQTVTVSLSAADTLGNLTTNFTWSFQLALPAVLSSNIVFLGSGTNAPANLILLSTNGNTFTYSYTGTSSGLSNGMQLINSDQVAGYKVTVVSFTEQTNNNTVVVVTRPTLLAELLQQGSLVSGSFTEVINGPIQPLLTQFGLQLNYSYPLNKVLYQDANLQIGTTPGSAVSLAEELKVAANFSGFTLTAFQATLEGTASFQLDFQALAQAAESYSGEVTLIQPVSRTFFGTIGLVPVWLTVVFEIDAGFDASLEAQGTITAGMSASKQVIYGKHWDQNTGWTLISQNPDASFSYQPPAWQIKGSADVTVYLLPKVTLLVDSLAGVTGDLKPHADLKYTFQLNPEECDLGLYAGLDSDLALDLTVWDSKWGQLPSVTFKLIPETLLWHTNCADTAPEIVLEPQAEVVTAGSRAVFEVEAQGSEPMTYQWWRGGLPLTDDGRITGSASATLSLDDVQASDAGGYSVHVSNPFGSTNSAAALLNIFSNSLVFIPPGTFTMGSPTNEAERFPDETQHTVTISRGFWMGKFLVTQGDYLAVVGSNPSYFNGFQQLPGIDYGTDLTRPVEQVDWYDATNYCGLRTQQERAGGLIPTNYVYRLPTESEWEYADRAGTTTAFYLGSGLHSGQANFDGQYEYDASVGTINNPSGIYLQQTTPVGSYAANPWGLYDMIGNVVEWCQDWYGGAYPAGSVTDPQGAVTGSSRVIRGGSLGGFAWFCRSATRIDLNPGTPGHGGIGFRVVLAPGQ